MGNITVIVAIIDFRVCPPLVKCQIVVFLGFIDTLMYGFSSTGVTIYCYFGLKFNDKRTLYIGTGSQKLKQVKAVIIICRTLNQIATME
jgi:hypothetical protein